ncbi:hypothetical protein LCGC14_1831430, partial [marine sediment metagenome]
HAVSVDRGERQTPTRPQTTSNLHRQREEALRPTVRSQR